jgi:hypothetical protein
MAELPGISDHALLRFIERILGIDVDALRGRILTQGVVAAIKAGASAVEVEGVKFVVKRGVIVTTLAPGQKFKPDEKCVAKVKDSDLLRSLDEFRGTEP